MVYEAVAFTFVSLFSRMAILLDDITGAEKFFPFGQLTSAVHIRLGMQSILEKWQSTGQEVYIKSEQNSISTDHLVEYHFFQIPSFNLLKSIKKGNSANEDFQTIQNVADIFKLNDWALREDFARLTYHKKSAALPKEIKTKNPENIFIEEGANLSHCYLNAETGPIYISRSATVMEGAMLRGPIFCGEKSVIKMGAKIYGATSIGPYCTAGGEIKNAVMMGFSNKAHDGYLGDAVLGQWCNLGAGTSNSNLKNNASDISLQISADGEKINVGIKCGLIMGDYSRSAINTSFNTGTVVGASCNIFGNELPPKFINNFTWGDEKYDIDKAIRDIDNWKKLKGFSITEKEIISLKKLYQQS